MSHTVPKIANLEKKFMRTVPDFRVGDSVRVHFRIVEGKKERIQVFEGQVIARSGAGTRETFTVRKISYGVGVERIFPVHSPRIEELEVSARGHVRRAKLFYLRERRGKSARISASRRQGSELASKQESKIGAAVGLAATEVEAEETQPEASE